MTVRPDSAFAPKFSKVGAILPHRAILFTDPPNHISIFRFARSQEAPIVYLPDEIEVVGDYLLSDFFHLVSDNAHLFFVCESALYLLI